MHFICDMIHSSSDSYDRTIESLRRGWVFLERTQILSGIQFTRQFIEVRTQETVPDRCQQRLQECMSRQSS